MSKVFTIQVLRPEAFSGQGSIISLELRSDRQALEVAQKLATEMGRRVVLRDESMKIVETIPAP